MACLLLNYLQGANFDLAAVAASILPAVVFVGANVLLLEEDPARVSVIVLEETFVLLVEGPVKDFVEDPGEACVVNLGGVHGVASLLVSASVFAAVLADLASFSGEDLAGAFEEAHFDRVEFDAGVACLMKWLEMLKLAEKVLARE